MSDTTDRDDRDDRAHPDHERLRRRLAARAASAGAAEPDFDDLSARLRSRHRKRQRVLGAAVAASILAGPAAGYAIGRTAVRRDAQVQASATGEPAGADATGGDGDAFGSTPAPVLPRSDAAGTVVASREVAGDAMLLGGYGAPLGRRFTRTTDDGVVLRVFDAKVEPYDAGNPLWTPPGWCFPSGYVQVDASTVDAVGIVSGGTYDELRNGALTATLGEFGSVEGAPVHVVVAQAPAGTRTVRATSGEARDEMAPADGIAVLAVPAPAGYTEGDAGKVRVEALDGDGAIVSALDLDLGLRGWTVITAQAATPTATPTGADAGPPLSPDADPACQAPPPALPPPGEQPADVDAARAAVVDAYTQAYTGTNSEEVRAAAMEGGDRFEEVFRQLRASSFAETVRQATVRVDELVFTAPDHAWVRYDIMLGEDPYGGFQDRFGEAVLVDGEWKLASSTMCRDVQLAGITCPET